MKFFKKKLLPFLLVVVLILSISVPCFAITPSYTEPSGFTFIESSMRKILIKRYNYNLAPTANKTFDNQFSYALYPFSDTVSEFDAIIDNASTFIGGISNGIMHSVQKAYRFITFNPETNTTNFVMYISKSTIYSEATFTLENFAGVNGLYYRFKQSNSNSSAAGPSNVFNYVCVSFPRSWTGGTNGVKYKMYLVQNNNFPEAQYCNFAYENLLWADSNTLSLIGNVQDSWTNYFSDHHFVAGAHIQNINSTRALDAGLRNYVIACGYDSSRQSSEGQYYLDFELYYDGFNVTDSFILDLLTYQNVIRFPDSNPTSITFKSYQLLSSSNRVTSSSGYLLDMIKFRIWFQPVNPSMLQYNFDIVWYTSIEWGTPLTSNRTNFLLDVIASDDNANVEDITQMWNELSGSLDFFRYTVRQLFMCFPSDIYYLTVLVIYLTILVAGLRLIL